jgi:hypothetical protein
MVGIGRTSKKSSRSTTNGGYTPTVAVGGCKNGKSGKGRGSGTVVVGGISTPTTSRQPTAKSNPSAPKKRSMNNDTHRKIPQAKRKAFSDTNNNSSPKNRRKRSRHKAPAGLATIMSLP